jgi:hypothetical protein
MPFGVFGSPTAVFMRPAPPEPAAEAVPVAPVSIGDVIQRLNARIAALEAKVAALETAANVGPPAEK